MRGEGGDGRCFVGLWVDYDSGWEGEGREGSGGGDGTVVVQAPGRREASRGSSSRGDPCLGPSLPFSLFLFLFLAQCTVQSRDGLVLALPVCGGTPCCKREGPEGTGCTLVECVNVMVVVGVNGRPHSEMLSLESSSKTRREETAGAEMGLRRTKAVQSE